jgi:hypothetical protein
LSSLCEAMKLHFTKVVKTRFTTQACSLSWAINPFCCFDSYCSSSNDHSLECSWAAYFVYISRVCCLLSDQSTEAGDRWYIILLQCGSILQEKITTFFVMELK